MSPIYVPGKVTLKYETVSPLLLDSYSGAAAAYSLRQLSWAYGGPVVRVRRDNDNAEQDFTATEVSDGTLASWVGAGNNGFVRTWYDQSGNGRHAQQGNSPNQPQIVSSGAVATIGTKPALSFDGSNDFMTVSSFGKTLLENNLTMFFAFKSSSTAGLSPLCFQNTVGSDIPWLVPVVDFSSGTQTRTYAAGGYILAQSYAAGASALYTFKHVSGVYTKTYNGTNTVSAAHPSTQTGETLYLGNWYSGYIGMSFPELIVYNADLSTSQAAIEANINAHYNIYP